MDVEKVSLVFSSYYLESPASAFGHTLLRFHRKGNKYKQKTRLLDMGINYAAQVTTDNALLYALFGLVGLFQGQYSAVPYFYKVREYSDFESRDLWTYDLKLTQKQRERLVDHLWEVGNTYFYYYYFSENCSYNLLTLLEVANFDLKLVEKLPSYFTIPGHTIQILNEAPGLVSAVHVEPSLRRRFARILKELTSDEKQIFFSIYAMKSLKNISKIDPERRALFLDVLIEYIDYLHSSEVLLGKGEISAWKKKILFMRSDYEGHAPPRVEVSADEAPHLGHGPRRMHFAGNRGTFSLGYRVAYHDYLDPNRGMPNLATIEFVDFEVTQKEGATYLEKLDFVDVMTLNPWTSYKKPWSLKANISLSTLPYYCQSCSIAQTKVGGGFTFFHGRGLTLFSFLSTRLLYASELNGYNNVELIPELGLKYSYNDYNLGVNYEHFQNVSIIEQYQKFSMELRRNYQEKYSFALDYRKFYNKNYKDDRFRFGFYIYY